MAKNDYLPRWKDAFDTWEEIYHTNVEAETKLVDGQPEERKYKAFFLDGDDEVGLESDVVKIVVP